MDSVSREGKDGQELVATAVPQKGSSGKFAIDKCLELIEENGGGDGKVFVKTDQERSIQFLVKDIVDSRKEGPSLRNLLCKAAGATGGLREGSRRWRKGSGRSS